MVAVLDPEAIIIPGGLAKAGDVLFDPIRNGLCKSLLSIYEQGVVVKPSTFDGATAAVLGAASQFLTIMPKMRVLKFTF